MSSEATNPSVRSLRTSQRQNIKRPVPSASRLSGEFANTSSAAALSPVPANSSLTLSSTLAQFGYAQGFDVANYLDGYYAKNSVSSAVGHINELEGRKELTAEELRAYVCTHYDSFINTTNSIINIDSEMTRLTSHFSQFSAQLNNLTAAANNFDFSDENYVRKHREIERAQYKQKKSQFSALSQLEELNEELRSNIYERKFEKAVANIEIIWKNYDFSADKEENHEKPQNYADNSNKSRLELQKSTEITALNAVKREIKQRTSQLIEMLLYELRSSSLKRFERKVIINFLVRLRYTAQTLQIFLQNRSENIKAELRNIKFQGEIVNYVQQLSNLVFSNLQTTCLEYFGLFSVESNRSANENFSLVIVWCCRELENYTNLFNKQVNKQENSLNKLGKCLKLAFLHANKLKSHGINLVQQLSRLFLPQLLEIISKNYRIVENLITEQLNNEDWRVTELWVHEAEPRAPKTKAKTAKASKTLPKKRQIKLTQSAKALYDVVRNLLREFSPLLELNLNDSTQNSMQTELYPAIINGMCSLLENFLLSMAQLARTNAVSPQFDDFQHLSIVANAYFLSIDLVPRVAKEFSRQFHRKINELNAFQGKIVKLFNALQDSFCQKRPQYWLNSVILWGNKCIPAYSNPLFDENNVNITGSWLNFNDYLCNLYGTVGKTLSQASVQPVISLAIEELLLTIAEATNWDKINLAFGGINQLIIDFRFLQAICGPELCTAKSNEVIEGIISRAVGSYCSKTKQSTEEVMKFTQTIPATIKNKVKSLNTIAKMSENDAK
jgi:hypothetical protein